MFLINGLVRLSDGTVSLKSVFQLSLADPGPPPAGTYSVQLLDATGAVLSTTSFEPTVPMIEGPNTPQYALFHLLIPAAPAATQIVIKQGATARLTRTASANPPTVTVQSPNGFEVLPPGDVTITWTANDADGDPLQFMVQYSPDNGATWTTLATSKTNLSHTVSRSSLKGNTTNARIRVLASDGFYTASDISNNAFTVPNNPPSLFVTEPRDQSLFTGQAQIFFQATGYDHEDGSDISNITWTSNLDGLLGTGLTLVRSAASLSVGTHGITATLTDSNAGTQSSTFNIQILRQRRLSLQAAALAPGAVSLYLNGDPGTPYQIEGSPDLQTWTTLETGTMSSPIREMRNPPGSAQRPYFYRARQ